MPSQNKLRFCAFLFFFPIFFFGQYFPSKNYTTTEGLPNNAVRALFLDSKNVLWIGTENGVSRMENGMFTNLDESTGLGHNSCWDISEDADGNIWFASYSGGVTKFDGRKFTVFTKKQKLPNERVRKLLPFKNKMYVGTELGPAIIDIKTNKVLVPKGILPQFGVFLVSDFFVFENEVYFSTINEGLFKIVYENKTPIIQEVFRHKFLYGLGFYDYIIYSGNKGFIDRFKVEDLISNKKKLKPIGNSIVWDFAKDSQNTLYAAAWGVFDLSGGLYSISDDKMIDISESYGITSKNLLNVVYNGKKNILYVGSKDNGIYEVQLDQIINYYNFNDKTIIDFEAIKTQKIILHQNGITFLNNENNALKNISLSDFKKYETDFIKKTKLKLPTHADGYYELDYNIPENKIEFYELLKHQNSLWVTSNIGIFELNFEGKIISYSPIHTYKIGFTNDHKFIETIPYGGVRVYDDLPNLKAKHFSEFDKHTPLDIVKILNNKEKTYLISVFNGLFVHEKDQFKSYLTDGIWKEKKFKHITKNNKGQLILAAEFGDVFVIEDSKSFKILNTISKKEIIGNTILFLEAYKDYILIGTEKGINIYKNGVIRLIDKEQGLQDSKITTSQIFANSLWLGTKKGYYTIDLNRLTATQLTVSEIGISKIAINNVPLKSSEYKWFRYNSKQLISDYKHNSFSIDFIPKGHSFPNKLKFRYRLNSNNRWSPYSEKTNLFLPYLPTGNYNVMIEVFDMNAGKSKVFTILQLYIQPPFWLSWWFISLVATILLIIIVLVFLRIKKKSNEKIIVQRRIAETKLEALLSQMNPHFTFNAMNTIQSYIAHREMEESMIYISEFSKLIRKTLENSSKQKITIDEEIEYLKAYIKIENKRLENPIDFELLISDEIDTHFTEIPTMLLQPFVENVFVHAFNESSQNPKLTISFKMISETILECKIIDNGMGINAAKKNKLHESKGIQLTKERLSLLQDSKENSIEINFSEHNGTTVTIMFWV
ncbi:sensor histidine kinase [Flavobacterium sp. UBA4854]|uniref:sensor histidine kinase n=1 Tax=Flavobacterium sp. UBA4854 TaxID=1946548 RepID=UPI00257C0A89|nr:histidine kinase [Flavobacterium sp. UBA4854]